MARYFTLIRWHLFCVVWLIFGCACGGNLREKTEVTRSTERPTRPITGPTETSGTETGQTKTSPRDQLIDTPKAREFMSLATSVDQLLGAEIKKLEGRPGFPVAGLENCGNTCYMNALLQALLHSDLGRYTEVPFDQIHFAQGVDKTKSLFRHFYDLADAYRKAASGTAASPRTIVDYLPELSAELKPGQQEDASEFLLKFFQRLSEELNLLKSNKLLTYNPTDEERANFLFNYYWIKAGEHGEYSIIDGLFDGIDKTRQMKTDGSVNIQYQKFNSIQLALDQTNETLTLEQLLANRAKEEIETSDPKTRSRQITIHQAPKTLILQLSRFTAAGKKITTKVQYPAKLSLTTAFDGPITFELFAVILHAGTLSGGHYTANVKSGNGKWFNANDSVVTAIDEAEALRDQAGAYVLFYRRAP